MTNQVILKCPKCNSDLSKKNNKNECINFHSFSIINGIFDFLTSDSPNIVHADGQYHNDSKDKWVDLNQLNTQRNLFYHNQVFDLISKNLKSGNITILELGGGNGFDLNLFINKGIDFNSYFFTEVSLGLVDYVKTSKEWPSNVFFATADAMSLPFQERQFNVVFLVAALHHLPDPFKGMEEIIRVLKPGGIFISAIEPNKKLWGVIHKITKYLRPILPRKKHSPADEEAEGFSIKEFHDFSYKFKWDLKLIQPVWVLNGLIHYGLEFIYRFFRLNRRLVLGRKTDFIITNIDNILVKNKYIRELSWHYTVVFKKQE
jgi:SAM-dependent methyltransferase